MTLLISQPTSLLSPLSLPLQAMTPATTTPIAMVPTSILGYGKELINVAKLYTNN
jgi:hypothetical protein